MFNTDIQSVLSANKPYIGAVFGKSMLPFLKEEKDHVQILPLREQPQKFDVVLYQRTNGQYVMHRIIAVQNQTYVMRGDNQYKKEHRICTEMCIGKLNGFWKNAGTSKEKYIPVTSTGYRVKVRLWHYAYPIRYTIRYIIAIAKAIKSKTERK